MVPVIKSIIKVFKTREEIKKYNPYHDERGRFTNSTGISRASGSYSIPKNPKDLKSGVIPEGVKTFSGEGKRNVTTSIGVIYSRGKVSNITEDKNNKDNTDKGKKEEISNNYTPNKLAGVERGKEMSFEEADGNKPNPNYNNGKEFTINCQTCVVAYEARRRGYDVEAIGNTKGSLPEMLSKATNKAWIDPKTGEHPEYIRPAVDSGIDTATKYIKYLKDTLKEDTRYTIEFGWKRSRSGHIVHIKNSKGEINIYDPQTGKQTNDLKGYFKDVRFRTTIYGMKFTTAPKLLEVENLNFNTEIVNKILKKVE